MRRSAAIIVMIIYGVLSIGVHMHLHYCCGKLSDISFITAQGCDHENESESESCCKKSDHCCSYADISLKLDESHSGSYFKIVLPTLAIESTGWVFTENTFTPFKKQSFHPRQHAPPADVPIYLSGCSLLFYA
jgi:hypothetical protein